MSVDLFLAGYIADQMESSADWRKRKAEEYPDDATRNLDCSGEFLKMAERLHAFEGGPWYERYCALGDDVAMRVTEALSQETETIHFVAKEPEELFRLLVEESGALPSASDATTDVKH